MTVPVILDRARQALVVNALEPEWEARFESRSYGFRPGRGAHDAIEAIFHVARGPHARRLWVLDADLTGAFDHIAQAPLLAALGTFPALRWVQGWLQAGVVEQSQWHPTETGTLCKAEDYAKLYMEMATFRDFSFNFFA